jgi:hypothetical protein
VNREIALSLIVIVLTELDTKKKIFEKMLVYRPELGRPRRRWEDNIKRDLQEVGGGRWDWMELAEDRNGWRALVSTVKNLRVP